MRIVWLFLLALPAAAEGEVALEWKFAEGDVFEISVKNERTAGMTTARGTLDTSFKVDVTAVFTVTAVGQDGVAEGDLTFKGLSGTVSAFALEQPLKVDLVALQEKKIPAKLTPRGQFTIDAAALKAVCAQVDLNDDLQNLFPVLPEEPVAKGAKWELDVERHKDELTLEDVREADGRRTAILGGTSKADQKADTGTDLKTELKVEGVWTASFNLADGTLKWSEQELSEDAVLETKESKLETRTRLRRTVGVVRLVGK
ncbi:MAG: hypothetical protein HYY18_20415 [Planctomycetes bacterium]|nr:hypothetical protein [Planctomycetota bacterium]